MTQHRSLAAHRVEEGAIQRTKLSQRLIDFAEPLTEAVGVGDFDTLSECMEIAAMCWNAALLAEGGDPTLEARLATIVRSSPPHDSVGDSETSRRSCDSLCRRPVHGRATGHQELVW